MNPLPRRALRCAPVLLGALAVVATLGRDRSAHADCFGHDSRVDLAHASPAWQARGRSVAALVAKKNVAVDAQHNITLTGPRVGAEEKLCPGQAFSTDVESAECTAFLIDRRRMVTAGHCLYPGIGPSLADLQAGCSNYFAIFDDAKDASGAVPHLTETANLFQCRRVLLYGAGGTTDDSAIFELDRDAGRPPLPLADDRTTPVAVAVGAPCAARSCVMGIGTPSGEPLKLAGPGTVVFLDPFGLAFKATLDGFHATSGSPVFDAVTGVVMGIDTLAANGGSDYVPNPANPSCNVVEVLPPGGSPRNGNYGNIGGASQITRIQRVFNREKQRDFDRDKRADILWRHDDGRLAIWEMNGAAVLHEGELEVVSNATKVVGTGDFDGDLHADILWERSNGLDIWEMNGLDIKLDGNQPAKPMKRINAAPAPAPGYRVVATGEFTADGLTDVVMRNLATGDVQLMPIDLIIPSVLHLGNRPSSWQLVGTGPFAGKPTDGIVWHDGGSGEVEIWFVDNNQVQTQSLGRAATSWVPVATGDFDGNGETDILWRHDGPSDGDGPQGAVAIWRTGVGRGPAEPFDPATKLGTTGDLNLDGTSDIVWRDGNGDVKVWLMNASAGHQQVFVRNVPSVWRILGRAEDP